MSHNPPTTSDQPPPIRPAGTGGDSSDVQRPFSGHQPDRRWLTRRLTVIAIILLVVVALQWVDSQLTLGVLISGKALTIVQPLARLHFFFREMGTVYTSAAIAIGIVLLDRKHWRRAVVLAMAVLMAAAVSGLLKPTLAKHRPTPDETQTTRDKYIYIKDHGVLPVDYGGLFRGWQEDSYKSMPSSHAASAVACFMVLSWYYHSGKPLFVVLAVGCALSRVWMADHYASDVLAGGMTGYLAAVVVYATLWRWSSSHK